MQTPNLPIEKWTELKKELVNRWHELTDEDLEKTQGRSDSLIELFEQKLGMTIDKASESLAEMASHYHLYNEPQDEDTLEEQKRSRTLELNPFKNERRS